MDIIANPRMVAIIQPWMITKYAPASEPKTKKITPALYTVDGLSKPSGKTPVPPENLVFLVMVSIPRL